MADDRTPGSGTGGSSGGGGWLPFVVGGLVVAVGVLAWVLFGGSDTTTSGGEVNVTVEGSESGSDTAGEGAQGATGSDDAAAGDGEAGGAADSGN